MFSGCKIKLFLDDEWIFVKLGGPRPLPVEKIASEAEMWQWFSKYSISGQFFVRENSITGVSDPGKFVVSTKWPDAFWAYSPLDQELNFISRGTWSGPMKYGDLDTVFNPVLTLHQARLTGNGVEPFDRSRRSGKATVRSGGNMPMLSRLGGIVKWEYRSLDWPSSQG